MNEVVIRLARRFKNSFRCAVGGRATGGST